jgi:hypothetical protein
MGKYILKINLKNAILAVLSEFVPKIRMKKDYGEPGG